MLTAVLGKVAFGLLFLLLTIRCIYPLVKWINSLNAEAPALLIHNSTLRPRHLLLFLLCPILWLPILLSELHLTPPDKMIPGWQLWGFQKSFLSEHDIIENDEAIKYFYSSATFDFRLDGNGLTENSLFSYWVDESGVLQQNTMRLDDMVRVTATRDDSIWNTGTLTAEDADGSEMLIYLPELRSCQAPMLLALKEALPKQARLRCG